MFISAANWRYICRLPDPLRRSKYYTWRLRNETRLSVHRNSDRADAIRNDRLSFLRKRDQHWQSLVNNNLPRPITGRRLAPRRAVNVKAHCNDSKKTPQFFALQTLARPISKILRTHQPSLVTNEPVDKTPSETNSRLCHSFAIISDRNKGWAHSQERNRC